MVCTLLLLCIIGFLAWDISLGSLTISLKDIVDSMFNSAQVTPIKQHILMDIRLPRALTALFAGISLGISGCLFQSLSRNPLGSPDVIGFTTGSATGALCAIVIFNLSMQGIIASAFIGGIATAVSVYVLASNRHLGESSYTLILTGLAVGSLLAAFNALLLVKGDLENAIQANFWLAGSLNARTWSHVIPLITCTCLCFPLAIVIARQLRMLEMGDAIAAQLGINVRKLSLYVLIVAVLLSSAATAACGPIAFIALAAPKIFQAIHKSTSVAVIGSGLTGGNLLLAADIFTLNKPFSWVLPIGQVTGILGGIYLLWIMVFASRKTQ